MTPKNSRVLQDCNSFVRVFSCSKMLDAAGVDAAQNIQDIKDRRRRRLASLLDEFGKVRLAAKVDISADYLWQMGKGKGKSRRGVSDNTARKLENALGQPLGWMDTGDKAPTAVREPRAPYSHLSYDEMDLLSIYRRASEPARAVIREQAMQVANLANPHQSTDTGDHHAP